MKTFETKRNELTIRGRIYGDTTHKHPSIILSHGFLDVQQSQETYALALSKLGYTCFTFDFCGGSAKSISDGNLIDMTIWSEVDDLIAVINYVRSLDYVDYDHLTLLGCSQGGFISAIVSAKLNLNEKLILCYPAFSIPHDARQGSMLMYHFDPNNIPLIIDGEYPIGRNYALTMQNVDPYELCSGYKGKVLLIHGNKDTFVDIKYSYDAKPVYKDLKFIEIDGAGHGFHDKDDELAISEMIEFMK